MFKGIWVWWWIGLGVITALAPMRANALDIGAPIVQKDLKGDLRLELIVERFDREAETKLAFDDASFLDQTSTDGMDQTVWMARLHVPFAKNGDLFFDAGMLDDDAADDTPFIIGFGLQQMIHDQGGLRINLVAHGHWVPSYDFSERHTGPYGVRYTLSGEKDYYELGAGMLVSGTAQIDRQAKLIPYGGIMFSVLRGSGDVEARDPDFAYSIDGTLDLDEDQPVVGVAGIALILARNITLRLEGRFIGDSSISAGMGVAF